MATRKKSSARTKKASASRGARKKATRKKAASRKKTTKKATARKTAKKKTTRKKTARKKVAKKKAAGRKKTAKKKVAKKKTTGRKKPAKKAARKKTASRAKPAKKTTSRKKTTKKTASRKAVTKKTGRGKASRADLLVNGPVAGIAPYKLRAKEKYMNARQLKHFTMILDAWKHELMEEVDRTVHHMKDEAANFPDPNDRATQESEFSLELRTRDRERKLIKKIDEAMLTMDSGDYGYCESCGVEIGVRRLEARPTATLCIDCKTLDEIREKQMRG
ncbi:MAG: RNA polymerase-binding protein DksA [Gammaproteobacteria bacterium]|nr:RNA polymerase-binding protein DksA [Gammaproteobacteria bacterium]NNF61137.1 RNA polymerase-binding protein DksA [Gammaproteobacteria bacterium]